MDDVPVWQIYNIPQPQGQQASGSDNQQPSSIVPVTQGNKMSNQQALNLTQTGANTFGMTGTSNMLGNAGASAGSQGIGGLIQSIGSIFGL